MPHRPDAAARPVRLDGIRPAPTRRRGPLRAAAATGALAAGLASSAPAADLADYFGFEGLEIVKIGRDAGPIATADMDGDGLLDLVVVNNHASRLEIHHQRADASPEDAARGPALAPDRVHEIPAHWRFRRSRCRTASRPSSPPISTATAGWT